MLLVVIGIRLWLKVQESQSQSLLTLANTAPLTGCFTRRYFIRQFESLVKNDKNRFCILLIDVDHLKKINFTYGHNTGVQVLVRFTVLLKHNLRNDDIIARWGGEEFIVLLPYIALTTGLNKAESLRQIIQETTIKLEQQTLSITASIGVVEYDKTLESFEKLVNIADQNLYLAKQQGRNRVIG